MMYPLFTINRVEKALEKLQKIRDTSLLLSNASNISWVGLYVALLVLGIYRNQQPLNENAIGFQMVHYSLEHEFLTY